MVSPCRAWVTPGLAFPAAQPQMEFTITSVVPGSLRAASTSATVLSGVTPHCASSSHMGRTASTLYKGCIVISSFSVTALAQSLGLARFSCSRAEPRLGHALLSLTTQHYQHQLLLSCAI